MNDGNLSIDHLCIGELASVLYRQFQIFMNKNMKPYRVSSSEVIYLLKVTENEAASQAALAEMFFTDSAIVTRILQSMEKGLIVRNSSNDDKRSMLVSLTPKGEEAKEAEPKIRTAWKNRVFKNLSEEEKSYMISLYKKMILQAPTITQGLEKRETDR